MPDITQGDLAGIDPSVLQLLLANGGLGGSPYVGNGNPPPVTPPFLPGRNPAIPLPKIGAPPSIPNPAAAVQQQASPTEDTATPAPSLRDRIMGGVNAAVSAASQPNQAMGGPKDTLRAFAGAQQAQQGQNLQQRALARQAQQDDLTKRATEASISNTTEDTASKVAEREAKAIQERAHALQYESGDQAKQDALDAKQQALLQKRQEEALKFGSMGAKKQDINAPVAAGYYAVPDVIDQTKQWVVPETKTHFVVNDKFRTMADDLGIGGLENGQLVSQDVWKTVAEAAAKKAAVDAKPDKIDEKQWIVDANNPDPKISTPAKANLALAAKQKLAGERPPAPGVVLSSDAIRQNADRYNTTGELPSLGMGAAGAKARQDILNAAAGGGGSISANKANYKADSGSLAALQKNRDAVVSFENTAGKNLDLFLQTAKPIVDTGVPWINKPLRAIGQGLGGQDLAAYNAARQVALSEIAKVVQNPGLTGQLSDAGRNEVSQLNPSSASLGQIYRVAGILKQDMANRHQSYDNQITEIKHRLSGGGQPAAGPSSGGKITVTAPDGSQQPFDTQAQADAFKKLANIP